MEWDNNDWQQITPELFQKCMEVRERKKRGEISQRQEDLLICKIMHDEINRERVRRQHVSGMSRSTQSVSLNNEAI